VTVTPTPSAKPTPAVSCGGAEGVTITAGNVATGEQYGPSTPMNDNQRWRCVPNPKNPSTGMWEECPGCPLTIISSTANLADEYKKEAEEFQEKVDEIAAEVYACGTSASCKSEVYAQHGLTAESAAYQELAKTNVAEQVKVYEGQDTYFEQRENWELCKAQQANDQNCEGYIQLANNALIAAGIDPTAAAEQLNATYRDYAVNKASSLYLIAQSDYTNCLAAKATQTSLDCSGYQKNATAALAYPGTTAADRAEITKLYTSYKNASDYVYQTDEDLCGTCTPARANELRRQRLETSGLTSAYQESLLAGRESQIVSLVQTNGPGSEVLVCEQVIGTAACNTLESARAALKSAVSASAQADLQVTFGLNDIAILNVNGSDAEVVKWANDHKTDPRLAGVSLTNAEAVRAALNRSLPENLRREALVETPQTIADANPESDYAEAFERYKWSQIESGDSHDRQKTDAQWQAEFDAMQLKALERMTPELKADGEYDKFLADVRAGRIIPTEYENEHHPFVQPPQGCNTACREAYLNGTAPRQGQTPLDKFFISVKTSWSNTFGMGKDESENQAEGTLAKYDVAPNPTLEADLALFYRQKPALEAAGYFRSGEESEEAFVQKILRGEVSVEDTIDDLGPLGTVRNKTWQAVASIGDGWITERLRPDASLAQQQLTAQIYVSEVVRAVPDLITRTEEQIKTDQETAAAYENFKKTTNNENASVEDFLVSQYAAALNIETKARAGLYDIEAIDAIMPSESGDASWLRTAALAGSLDIGKLQSDLAKAKTEYELMKDEAKAEYDAERARPTINSQLAYEQYTEKLKQASRPQADILASAYFDSLDPADIAAATAKMEVKLEDQNITIPVETYQKQQLAAFLNDEDVQFLMRSGGVDITLDGVLDGTYNMERASELLTDIRQTDTLAALALDLNKFENGGLLKGQLLRDRANLAWDEAKCDDKNAFATAECRQAMWDNTRGAVMMTAKPVGTTLMVAVPALRLAQLAGTAISAQTALAVAGEALSIQMTGSSLQDTAEVCTARVDMDAWGCAQSAGMTLFAASSILPASKQVSTLARIARIERANTGALTLLDTVDNAVAGSRITSWMVPKADQAVAQLAALPKAAVAAGATEQAVISQSNTVAQNLVRTVYSGAAEPVAVQMGRNALGATVFGAQAVQVCSQNGINADCLTSAGMAMVAAARVITGPITAAQTGGANVTRAVTRADQFVNSAQALTACGAAALGETSYENCATSIAMAGLGFGQEAVAQSRAEAPRVENPFIVRDTVAADLTLLQEVSAGQTVTITDGTTVTADNLARVRASLLNNLSLLDTVRPETPVTLTDGTTVTVENVGAVRLRLSGDVERLSQVAAPRTVTLSDGRVVDVQNVDQVRTTLAEQLGGATAAMAQTIAQTNQIVTRFRNTAPEDEALMTPAQRGLAEAIATWERYITPTGEVRTGEAIGGFAGLTERVVTGSMVEAAQRAVDIAQRQVVDAEIASTVRDPRNTAEQLVDRVLRREPVEIQRYRQAVETFRRVAQTNAPESVAYREAIRTVRSMEQAAGEYRLTNAQKDIAARRNAAQDNLEGAAREIEAIRERMRLLGESDENVAFELILRQEQLQRATNDLDLLRTQGASPERIAIAEEAARVALAAVERVQQIQLERSALTTADMRANRASEIERRELLPRQIEARGYSEQVALFTRQLESSRTLTGQVRELVVRVLNRAPLSAENAPARELRRVREAINRQLGADVSEESVALYREFSNASTEMDRVRRAVNILNRYDPARTGIEGPLTETRAQRLAQIEEVSRGYFQDILPDQTARSIEQIRAGVQDVTVGRRGLFGTRSNADVMTAFDELIVQHQRLVDEPGSRDLILRSHEQAMTRLDTALERLYGRDTPEYKRASIEVRKALKQIDLATQIAKAEQLGDSNLAARLRQTQEVNLSMFGSLNEATRLGLEHIIRDTEYRLTIYEQDFRSLRAKQLETIFGLLSNDGTAIELTTAGGKTWVVSAISRIHNEVFGRKAIIMFRKGQAGQLMEYVKSVYPGDDAVVRMTSDMLQGDQTVTSRALSQIENAKVLIVEPEDMAFVRNMATMKYDNPRVRADIIHAYLSSIKNTGFSIDELNLALDTNTRMINPANGIDSVEIEEILLATREDVGRVLLDLSILQDGKFDAWRTSENGVAALTEGYIVTRTNPDGSVTQQFIRNAKFTQAALDRVLPALERQFGLDDGVLRRVSAIRDSAGTSGAAYETALRDAGITVETAARAADVLGALNTYANAMTMVPGTAYFRGINSFGIRSTIPGAEGVASPQQTYNKHLQPVMEIVGALANGEGFKTIKGSKMSVAPERAYQSTVADVIADAVILYGDVHVGGVTGTIGSAYDVLANAYRMVTNVDGETARRIFDEGRLRADRFTVSRQEDIVRVLAEQIAQGVYNTSVGKSANGNLKITLGGDLGLSSLEVAREIVRRTGDTNKTYVLGVNGDTFYEVKFNADGTIADGYADADGLPNKTITTDEVSQWYVNEGRGDIVSILDRGSATGGNIRTPDSVPGALLTSDTAPEYLVLQAASRLDRTGGLADQHLLLARQNAATFGADGVTLDTLRGTPDEFTNFRENAIRVQDAYAKEQSAQANTLGMELAASRPLAHGVMTFGTIDSPVARDVADWLSDRLLEMSTHESLEDTSLVVRADISADTQQRTLAARNSRFAQLTDFYQRLFDAPENQAYLNVIRDTAPAIYERMLNSRNALLDVPTGADPLAYATAQGGTSKDAPLLQGDLLSYRRAHNVSVTEASEASFTGGTVDQKRIAQARAAAETMQNQEVSRQILSQNGARAGDIAQRASPTRPLSVGDRATLSLTANAITFYQNLVSQARAAIEQNHNQRAERIAASNNNAIRADDVVVGLFVPAERQPCAVYDPFHIRVVAASPCLPVGTRQITDPHRVAVTIEKGTKATWTDVNGAHDIVFDGASAVLSLSGIHALVLHLEDGDVTLSSEDINRIRSGANTKAIALHTYQQAINTIQTTTQQFESWGITDESAEAIVNAVRRDAEARVRRAAGNGTFEASALSAAVDAVVSYEQAAHRDLARMRQGDLLNVTTEQMETRQAESRNRAAAALHDLLPNSTASEVEQRLADVTRRSMTDLIAAQRRQVSRAIAQAERAKRVAATVDWWRGLPNRTATAIRNVFVLQPPTYVSLIGAIRQQIGGQVAAPQVRAPRTQSVWADVWTAYNWSLGAHPFGAFGQIANRLVTGQGPWMTGEQIGQLFFWGGTRIAPFFVGQPWIAIAFLANDIIIQPPVRLIESGIRTTNVALTIPTIQNFFHGDWLMPLMNSPRFAQPLKNILAGSRTGTLESTVNATPFAIGDPNWNILRATLQTVQWTTSFVTAAPLRIGWDVYRIGRLFANRNQPAIPMAQYVKNPDNWTTRGYELWIFPKAWINATPRNNARVWLISRPLMTVAAIFFPPLHAISSPLWVYDFQRFADEGLAGWNRFWAAPNGRTVWWIPRSEWAELATPATPVTPSASTPRPRPTIRQFIARVITASPRQDRAMFWISRAIFALTPGPFWVTRALLVLGFDGARLVSSGIAGSPTLSGWFDAMTHNNGNIVARFFNANPANGFSGILGYAVSRFIVLPMVVGILGVVFGALGIFGAIPAFLVTLLVPVVIGYDTLRVGMWAHNLGRTVVRVSATPAEEAQQIANLAVVQQAALSQLEILAHEVEEARRALEVATTRRNELLQRKNTTDPDAARRDAEEAYNLAREAQQREEERVQRAQDALQQAKDAVAIAERQIDELTPDGGSSAPIAIDIQVVKGKGVYTLTPQATPIVIGRSVSAAIQVPTALDDSVSREHAEIFYQNGVYTLRDLNSRNGTVIQRGNQIIRVTDGEALSQGDILYLGTQGTSYVFTGAALVGPSARFIGESANSLRAEDVLQVSRYTEQEALGEMRNWLEGLIYTTDSLDVARLIIADQLRDLLSKEGLNGAELEKAITILSQRMSVESVLTMHADRIDNRLQGERQTIIGRIGFDRSTPEEQEIPSQVRVYQNVYTSSGGQQLKIDIEHDAELRAALDRAIGDIAALRRNDPRLSRLDAIAAWVNNPDNFRYDKETQQEIYAMFGEEASLGQFVLNAGVCREKAFFVDIVARMLGVESEVMVVSFKEGGRHAFNYFPGRGRVVDATNRNYSQTFDEYLDYLASINGGLHIQEDAQGRLVINRYRNVLTVSEAEFIARRNTPVEVRSNDVAAAALAIRERELALEGWHARLLGALNELQLRASELRLAQLDRDNAVQDASLAKAALDAQVAFDIDAEIQKIEADIPVLEQSVAAKQLAYDQEKAKADAAAALIVAQQELNTFLAGLRAQGIGIGALDIQALWGNATGMSQAFNNLISPIIAREQQNLTVLQNLQRALLAGTVPASGFVRDIISGSNVMDAIALAISTEEARIAAAQQNPDVIVVQVPVSSGASQAPAAIVDLTGLTLVGVILPADTGEGIGVPVIAQYRDAAGEIHEYPGVIRSQGINNTTWNVSIDGVSAPITVATSQFIPTTVYVAGPVGAMAQADVDALVQGLFGEVNAAAALVTSAQMNPTQCSDCSDFVRSTIMPLLARAQQARVAGNIGEAIGFFDQILAVIDQHENNHKAGSGHIDAGKPSNTILFNMVRYLVYSRQAALLVGTPDEPRAGALRDTARLARRFAMNAIRSELRGNNTTQANEVFAFIRDQRKADLAAILSMGNALAAQQELDNIRAEITNRSTGRINGLLDAAADLILRNNPLVEYSQEIAAAEAHIAQLQSIAAVVPGVQNMPPRIQSVLERAEVGKRSRQKTKSETYVSSVSLNAAGTGFYTVNRFISRYAQFTNHISDFIESKIIPNEVDLSKESIQLLKDEYTKLGYNFTEEEIGQFTALRADLNGAYLMQHAMREKVAALLGITIDYKGIADEYFSRMTGDDAENRAQVQSWVDQYKKLIASGKLQAKFNGSQLDLTGLTNTEAVLLQAIEARVNGGSYRDKRALSDISDDELYVAAASIRLSYQDVLYAFGSIRTYFDLNIAIRDDLNNSVHEKAGLDITFGSGRYAVPYNVVDAKMGYLKQDVDSTAVGFKSYQSNGHFVLTSQFSDAVGLVNTIAHEMIHENQTEVTNQSIDTPPTYKEAFTSGLAQLIYPEASIAYGTAVTRMLAAIEVLRAIGVDEKIIWQAVAITAHTGKVHEDDVTASTTRQYFGDLFDQQFGRDAFVAWMSEEVKGFSKNSDAWFYSTEQYTRDARIIIDGYHRLYLMVASLFSQRPQGVDMTEAGSFTEVWFTQMGKAEAYPLFRLRNERYGDIVELYKYLRAEESAVEGEELTKIQEQIVQTRQLIERVGKGDFSIVDQSNFDLDALVPGVDRTAARNLEQAEATFEAISSLGYSEVYERLSELAAQLQQIADGVERGEYGRFTLRVQEEIQHMAHFLEMAIESRHRVADIRASTDDIAGMIESYREKLNLVTVRSERWRNEKFAKRETLYLQAYGEVLIDEIIDMEQQMYGETRYKSNSALNTNNLDDARVFVSDAQEALATTSEAYELWLRTSLNDAISASTRQRLITLNEERATGVVVGAEDRASDILRGAYENELRNQRLPIFSPEQVFLRLIEQTERNGNLEEAAELARDLADMTGLITRAVSDVRLSWNSPNDTADLADQATDRVLARFAELNISPTLFVLYWNSKVSVQIGDIHQLMEHMIAGTENTGREAGETYARLATPIFANQVFGPMVTYLTQLNTQTSSVVRTDNPVRTRTRLESAIDAYNREAPDARQYTRRTAETDGHYDVLSPVEDRLNDFLSQLERWGVVLEVTSEEPEVAEGAEPGEDPVVIEEPVISEEPVEPSPITTAGSTYTFTMPEIQETSVMLGAEEVADVHFAAGQAEVGHVRLYVVDGKLTVDGIEGTVINRGSRAIPASEAEVRNRDIITLGQNGPKVRILINGETVTVKVLSLRTEQKKKKSPVVHIIEVLGDEEDGESQDTGNVVTEVVDVLTTMVSTRLDADDRQRAQIQSAVATGLAGGTNAINIIVQLTDEESALSEAIRLVTDVAGSTAVMLTHLPEVMQIITSSNLDDAPSAIEDLIIRIRAEQEQSFVRLEALTDAEAAPIVAALLSGNLEEAVRLTTELGIDGSGQLTVLPSFPVDGTSVNVTIPNTLIAVVVGYNAAGPAEDVTAGEFLQRLTRYLDAVENNGLTAPVNTEGIHQAVEVVETVLINEFDAPREPGCRALLCGFSSDLIEGRLLSADIEAVEYQVTDLNAARGIDPQQSFSHIITIATINGQRFLVDLTFAQFIDTVSGFVSDTEPDRLTTTRADDPLVQELLRNGYFRLTDETLTRYLQMTSLGDEQPSVTLAMLADVEIRARNSESHITDEEVQQYISGTNPTEGFTQIKPTNAPKISYTIGPVGSGADIEVDTEVSGTLNTLQSVVILDDMLVNGSARVSFQTGPRTIYKDGKPLFTVRGMSTPQNPIDPSIPVVLAEPTGNLVAARVGEMAQIMGLTTEEAQQMAQRVMVDMDIDEAVLLAITQDVREVLEDDSRLSGPLQRHFAQNISRADLTKAIFVVYAETMQQMGVVHARQIPDVLRQEQLALEALEAANSGWVRGASETEETFRETHAPEITTELLQQLFPNETQYHVPTDETLARLEDIYGISEDGLVTLISDIAHYLWLRPPGEVGGQSGTSADDSGGLPGGGVSDEVLQILAEIRAELDQEQVAFERLQNADAQQRRIAISQLAEEIEREETQRQNEDAARIAALQAAEAELVRLRQQAITDQKVLDDINALEERIRQRKIAYEASRPQPAPIPVVNIDFVPEPEPEVEPGTPLFSDAWVEFIEDMGRGSFADFAPDIQALIAAANAETNAALQREILARMDAAVIAAIDAIGNEIPFVSDNAVNEMRARIAARQEARER